jgi:hypothetical protein
MTEIRGFIVAMPTALTTRRPFVVWISATALDGASYGTSLADSWPAPNTRPTSITYCQLRLARDDNPRIIHVCVGSGAAG